MKRYLILDSSFNPLHKGHLRMMQIAAEKFKSFTKILLLSSTNAEKIVNNFDAKLEMLNRLGDSSLIIKTCSEKRFIDKTKLFSDGQQVYIMGYDTITRFFDRKYYDDYENDIKSFFDSAEICVFDRGDCEQEFWEREEMRVGLKWKSKITVFGRIPGNISSTTARALVRQFHKTGQDLERLKEIIPAPVLEIILAKKLYAE